MAADASERFWFITLQRLDNKVFIEAGLVVHRPAGVVKGGVHRCTTGVTLRAGRVKTSFKTLLRGNHNSTHIYFCHF